MGRGLDGFFDPRPVALCSFEGPGRRGLSHFPVVLARGKHLFPFRTEQLSPSAPMVLGPHGPGRVGRRRINLERPSHKEGLSRLISRWAPSVWVPECAFNHD